MQLLWPSQCKLRILTWLVILLIPTLLLGDITKPTHLNYRGFIIDESRTLEMTNFEAALTATKGQIDIVCAVGVPARMLSFFKSQTIHLVQGGKTQFMGGDYSFKTKMVNISSEYILMYPHKPVLLHELLHAFHDQRLPGGFENLRIKTFYEHAKSLNVYAADSHMMSNVKEFFACSGTTYLYGVTAQEPFNREKIKDSQPIYFNYLKTLFGPNAGNYAGSLTP